jgi:hypothetical protein
MANDRRTYFDGGRPEPVGVPKWTPTTGAEEKCPHCGAQLCVVRCPVKPPPMLRAPAGKAVACYLGCPACPYASPAVMMAGEP